MFEHCYIYSVVSQMPVVRRFRNQLQRRARRKTNLQDKNIFGIVQPTHPNALTFGPSSSANKLINALLDPYS